MRILRLLYVTLIAVAIASSGPPTKYSQIRVFVPNKEALDQIWASGIDFEGASGKIGGWMEFVAAEFELRELDARKVGYSVVVDDAAKRVGEELAPQPFDAMGFGYGSMGGYYTYAEVAAQLDSMRAHFPALITSKAPIGYSIEGRQLWSVKISDHPESDEDEPEALYTALHHAREPGGMMAMIYYMWWLLEQYGTDPRATYLVDNRELWFIPVVNPDGYVYNQSTNPAGGGFWRKNRRSNGNGTFGIDLNRNYGTYDMWNAPNGGSSTNTGSDTYRGPEPFSEPETQAIDGFMRSHAIVTALNFHTYGRYLIYPWGYLSGETQDSLTFREFGFDMVSTNRHTNGTDLQTVNYSTRGNSDDYMYGDDTKPQTYAMTPELGDSFWPPSSQIFPIAAENLDMNIYCSYVAGQYSMLKSFTINDAEADGDLEPGESFTLNAVIRNKGLGAAAGLQVTLTPADASVSFSPPSAAISVLPARSHVTVPIAGSVSSAAPHGGAAKVFVDVSDSSGYTHRDTVTLFLGDESLLFSDNAEAGTSRWTTGAAWGTSAVAHAGSYSFTDSPAGNYPLNGNSALQLASPVSLAGCNHAVLRYWTKWSIEPTWDFATVELSTDGGSSWMPLRSSLSHAGSGRGSQALGAWGYDGYVPGLDWVFQEIDLTPYAGEQILVRFRLASDGGDSRDGIYVDDIRIVGYRPLVKPTTLFIADNGSGSAELVFGEYPLGTDGIDSLIGEAALPGLPAPGVFDARWQIAPTPGGIVDMRPLLGPLRTSNTFLAAVQPGPGGFPLTLRWNGKHLQPGGWRMRDAATSGGAFSVNMWLDSALVISDTSVRAIEIVHTQTDSFAFTFQSGWRLVSLPMVVDDASLATLFPGAISNAWAFTESGYQPSDPLETGRGYWLKFASSGTAHLVGVPVVQDTIVIPAGWSIVPASAVICPQSEAILNCPGCSPFYSYSNGYAMATTGLPGAGWFVKGPRTIIYSCFHSESAAPKAAGSELPSGFGTLSIGDAAGGKSILYFGAEGTAERSLDAYELPPVPPAGLFDARFASQRFVEEFPSVGGDKDILIRSSHYPLSLSWSTGEATMELERLVDGASAGVQTLHGSGQALISDARVTGLRLRSSAAASASPAEFSLEQNYPNPFNPSTTISYLIAERSIVTLKVTNILGETVATLVDRADLPAGRYAAVFDASAMSSGIYFTAMTAAPLHGAGGGSFVNKMLLVK